MANIAKIKVDDVVYDIEDSVARAGVGENAVEISQLKSAIGVSEQQSTVNFENVETQDVLISGSTGKWWSGSNSATYFVAVPDSATKLHITANTSYVTVYSLLADNSCTVGDLPNYATGGGRIVLSKGESTEVEIPSDCTYVAFMKSYNTDNYTPSEAYFDVIVGETGLAKDIDTLRDQISAVASGGNLKDSIKQALLSVLQICLTNSAEADERYNALYSALYDAEVISLSAIFTQGSNLVFSCDSLEVLRQYLTVTAVYDNGTSGRVSVYGLSGELTAGTSTITVQYGSVTTTFTVNVTEGTDVTPALSAYTPTDTNRIGLTILSNGFTVFTKSNVTYAGASAHIAFKKGYTYRLSLDQEYTSGEAYIGMRDVTTGGTGVGLGAFETATTVSKHLQEDRVPSNSANWDDTNSPANGALQFYCTWSSAKTGNVTYKNIKLIEYMAGE